MSARPPVSPFGGVPLGIRPSAEPDVIVPCTSFSARAAIGPSGEPVLVLGLSRTGMTASVIMGTEDVQRLRDAAEAFLAARAAGPLVVPEGKL